MDNKQVSPNTISFLPTRDTTLSGESYRSDATDQLITVEVATLMGFFYAVQTLYQLLPQRAGCVST